MKEVRGRKKTGLSHDSHLSQTHGEKKQKGGGGALMLADALQRGREEEEKQEQEERREELGAGHFACTEGRSTQTNAKRAAADWQHSRRTESESRRSREEITANRTPCRVSTKRSDPVSNRFCQPTLQFWMNLEVDCV